MAPQKLAELQDLGSDSKILRREEDVSARGVESLVPDEGESHLEAMKEIREVIDEHYGDQIEDIAPAGHEAVVERIVLRSETVPHVEYTLVEELVELGEEL
jgi:hypothetical protein